MEGLPPVAIPSGTLRADLTERVENAYRATPIQRGAIATAAQGLVATRFEVDPILEEYRPSLVTTFCLHADA